MTTLAFVLLAMSATGCADDGGRDTQTQDAANTATLSDVADTGLSDVAEGFDADTRTGDDTRQDAAGPDTGPDARQDADAAGDSPTWSAQVWPILQTYGCSSDYCHGGGKGGLDWGSADATYDELVGVVSDDDGGCSDLARVAPSDSTNSLLYQKLAGTQDCGGKMPKSGDLTSAELDIVRAWIDGGAQR
jgi:hypothetical protein